MRRLLIERLSVSDATLQKLWPVWHCWLRVSRVRQQAPQGRVVPAEFMSRTVAVMADTLPQPLDLGNKLFA
jgi:hypothetical protein